MTGPHYISPGLRAVLERRQSMRDEAMASPGRSFPAYVTTGDELPPPPSEPLTDAVVRLRRQGLTVLEIAQRMRTTHTTVYRYLRLAGATDGIRPYRKRTRTEETA